MLHDTERNDRFPIAHKAALLSNFSRLGEGEQPALLLQLCSQQRARKVNVRHAVQL